MDLEMRNMDTKDKAVDWSKLSVGLNFDEVQIIRDIMTLHNNGEPFELDPTFSKGSFWKGLEEPKYKFDIEPEREDVLKADCRGLPFENESINSIMFGPPFVAGPSPRPGIIRDRFTCYKTVQDLWKFYEESFDEFYRVLKPEGIIAFKCQPVISGSVQYMSHFKIGAYAQKIGLYILDQFILGRKNVLWSPSMANQQHTRKNYCFYLVLKKTDVTKRSRHKAIFI